MNDARKFFLIAIGVLSFGAIIAIAALTFMEHQARAALPPEEQTAEAIASIYDGAVCLGCDYGRVFFAMFGSLSVAAVLACWGVYEAGRAILLRLWRVE